LKKKTIKFHTAISLHSSFLIKATIFTLILFTFGFNGLNETCDEFDAVLVCCAHESLWINKDFRLREKLFHLTP